MTRETKDLTPSERGLLWAATVPSILALVMIVGPYVGCYISKLGMKGDQAFRVGIAWDMTFGLLMLAVGGFSWITSLIMLAINCIYNTAALHTRLGRFTVISDAFIFCYGVFFLIILIIVGR